jgi:two-component system, NtrC family, sensor kinase
MTALPPDAAADLRRVVADLERELQASRAERDDAIKSQAAAALESARLQNALNIARDRQNASAGILRSIAGASGDAEGSLYQIAETSARLFGATSATIQIAEGDGWSQIIRVGDSSKKIGAGVPEAQLRIGGRNMPGTIVAENRQVHVPDLDNVDPSIADWPGLPYARAAGTRSMSGSPLRREGKAIGTLIVYRDRLAPFTDEELALQQSFADQAAIAIENARLFNETREALERQTATADILKAIASSPTDVQPVFEAIAASANRLIGGFSTAVFRFINGASHLAAFTPTHPVADEVLKASFPRPLAGFQPFENANMGEPVQIADTEAADARIRDIARARGFRSMLFSPLMSNGEAIGLISVTRLQPGSFAAHHVQLLQTFADQAVIAIENVGLFEEVQARTRDLSESLQQQTATAEVLKVISRSAFDLDTVMNTLSRSAAELCGADLSALFLRDGEFLALRGYSDVDAKVSDFLRQARVAIDDQSHMGRCLLSGSVANVADFESDTTSRVRTFQQALGFKAILIVPLMREGRGVGVFALCRNQVGAFSERQIELVQTFADQAVIAIENVRLFDEVQAKTRDLSEALQQQTATADVLKVISRSAFDLQAVLDTLVESASTLCNADQGMLLLFEDGVLKPHSYFGPHPDKFEFRKSLAAAPHRGNLSGRAVLDGQTAHVADVLIDPQFTNNSWQQLTGFRAMLAVPLMRQGQPIGAMALSRTTPGLFADRQIELVTTFADQAVIAIENVRLFDEVQAKTRDLSESLQQQTATADVLKVISRSAFDLQTVLDTLVISAARLCDADRACIFQKDGDVYRWVSNFGFSPELIAYADTHPFTAGPHSTTSRVALEGKPIHNPDVLADPNYTASEYQRLGNYRTMLGIPLLREGAPIGVFILTREQVRPFADRQIELVTTFADQAVIAIENVRLFDEVQQRTRELAASLEDLRTAQDRLIQTEKLASLGQLTAGIAHEIKNPLNFVNNFAALSAELTDELNDVLRPAALDGKIREEVDELTGMLKDNLEKVVQHGKRADSIVKNMLLHSREGSGEHRPADINALLDESLNLAYHGARAERPAFNVTLQRDFDAAAGTVEVFPQEITRVLLNLIANGFYAVAKRKAELGDSGFDPVLRASTKSLGDTVEIRIRDNGTGIPSHVKEKMFNPFFTTKPAGEGTGLGLSMSHDIIVKQHGGTIDVETAPGQFTEFTILLPRASNPSSKNRGQM